MKTLPTKETLEQLFVADFETGRLIWRWRDESWFENPRKMSSWNARFAGKEVGHFDKHNYKICKMFNQNFKVHRILWKMKFDEDPIYIDHINGNKSDNAISNLRSVTHQENMLNRRLTKVNSSGIQGVSWRKDQKKWQVQIRYKGKNVNVGFFDDIELAALANSEAKAKYGYHPNHGRITE